MNKRTTEMASENGSELGFSTASLCSLMKSATVEKPAFAQVGGDLSIKDSSVPLEVQEFFSANKTRHIAVCEKDGILWVASKLKAKRIDLGSYREFEICYMTRAKGGGFVAIQAWPKVKGQACATIMEFGAFSDQALQSAEQCATELQPVLGYRLHESNWGPDC